MSIKQDRTSDRIQVILSELLKKEVSDPRLQSVTITEVKVDVEIMVANIYVNALGDETREKQVMGALAKASGFLRKETANRMRLRTFPEFRFHWDTALEYGEKMNQIISRLDIPKEEPTPVQKSELDSWFASLFEDED